MISRTEPGLILSGVFFNDDELEEFNRAIRVACLTDPLISPPLDKWNDNKAAHIRKDILTRWVREYLATYEKPVNDDQK